MLAAAEARGAEVRNGYRLTGWREADQEATLDVERGGTAVQFRARHIVLALGAGYVHVPELAALLLNRVKGQAVTVARPAALPDLPALAGRGYVAPLGGRLVLGSSFEHTFDHAGPDPAQSRSIIDKVSQMLPLLSEADILAEQAGIRVTVPGTRLPMVGPLPGYRRVWVFTGLGSKGLMTAPLLSARLPDFLRDPDQIPSDVAVRPR
jgi:glycine/D-amino acid oxidase-like deaminating enzyme